MLNACCLCEEMKGLWKEQQMLSEFGKGFRFVHMPNRKDTIPFMLQTTDQSTPFTAITDGLSTPYFRLEKIDEESCCVQLSMLLPVDIKGQPAMTDHDLYALRKTSHCILVKICGFCSITPLPFELVGRTLPVVESKI